MVMKFTTGAVKRNRLILIEQVVIYKGKIVRDHICGHSQDSGLLVAAMYFCQHHTLHEKVFLQSSQLLLPRLMNVLSLHIQP